MQVIAYVEHSGRRNLPAITRRICNPIPKAADDCDSAKQLRSQALLGRDRAEVRTGGETIVASPLLTVVIALHLNSAERWYS